jgi:protein-S-isoprenylcysteine O-methyltransferase Ste14
MYSLAVARIYFMNWSFSEMNERLLPRVFIVAVFTLISMTGSFLMSGMTGLIGSGIACVLWGGWLLLMWIPSTTVSRAIIPTDTESAVTNHVANHSIR